MQPVNTAVNGRLGHWVEVRPEPSGQYTAQAVGLPEVAATAPSREEAIRRVCVAGAPKISGHWPQCDIHGLIMKPDSRSHANNRFGH